MNFRELKHIFIKEITGLYTPEEAGSVFYLVIEHIFTWNKSIFFNHRDEQVSTIYEQACSTIIDDLKMGIPIQYILGETLFYGLRYSVNTAVLIPRVETEELVDWVIHKINDQHHKLHFNILDIGTGSGCIAVTLKKNLQKSRLTALDVSRDALAVAQFNATLNNAEVTFIEADILNYKSRLKYDVIVSNPPYVKEDEKREMHQNVLDHEPHLALFVDNDQPLLFYEAIADFACTNLNKGGFLFFEINEFLGKETVHMLASRRFTNIELKQDMQGKDRMIFCTLPA